jgi:hypothetical protein
VPNVGEKESADRRRKGVCRVQEKTIAPSIGKTRS